MLIPLVRRFARPYLLPVVAILVLQLTAQIAALYLPSLNGQIIDEGVVTGDTGIITRLGATMLGVSLIQIVATIAAIYLAARTAGSVGRDLRAGVFHHIGEFSAQEVTRFGAPTLISRTTNDVTQVQQLVFMGLALMVTTPIGMIGGVIMALREDLGLSWLLVVVVPVLAIFVSLVVRAMVPSFRLMQECVDWVNRVLREQITGVRVVRAFVREDHERDRFAAANAAYTGTALRTGRLMASTFPVVMFIFNISTIAVLWFGAHRIDTGSMQIGEMTAFMAYLMQILMSVMMATMMSMMIPRAAVSSVRISEVLDTVASVSEPSAPIQLHRGSGTGVVMDDVSFAYPGAEQPVLQGISFRAEPGQTTAIIGSTGAGKTTLLNLIPRLYDVTGGHVQFHSGSEQTDIRELSLDDVWARVGLVPQRPYLFTGTVASNLRYGNPEASDDDLWRALEIAQAKDFVTQMKDGLDSPIAQGGTNVSGGQRQRLAIARALVRNPDIFLFDDSFSALDLATDARLRAALRPHTRNATVIVVAQRVSTIVDADQILVLDDGRIVGAGTHDDLLTDCPTYAEIVASQRAAHEEAA